ncbi:hypothetical protein BKA58DRAFT_471524 [Alternaria rosae]|uniref:uncharacterized protein n=1 Tax=Alternaria rosae TaxID=1187941 RepID=UPI001E8D6343|nr:uncharacterized protein BKA58DRAFT_471524 [Alternaria rosae]KAH6865559.1 hypothetical protein BKA58DRAFT_471524 [Alternaria rosae]
MPSIQSISLAFIALLATTNAITVSDGGAAGGCPGGCCIPACNVIAFGEGDDLGAFGTASFADTCKQNYDRKNGGTVDLGDDHQATWVYEGEDKVFLDVFRKSDKKYNRFEITNCQLASTGGSQCAPSGGGCDAKLILVEQQG